MSSRGPELSVTAGDCVAVMAAMPAASVDAIVTDPPYGLEFMGKDWDRLGDVGKTSHGGFTDGTGFKGFRLASYSGSSNVKCGRCDRWKWDHEGRRCECGPDATWPNVKALEGQRMQAWHETWAREALRVLKPGGHLLAFGGTRTYHRLACAIEDAGFEIRDTIAWLYGSGFPKSLDAARAVRGDLAKRWFRAPYGTPLANVLWLALDNAVPVVEAAAGRVEGHGTALKPAHEPIVVARRPLTGTVAANVLAHGCGALNVDGCRIEGAPDLRGRDRPGNVPNGNGQTHGAMERAPYEVPAGRWPANVCLDEQAAELLDEQTGTLTSGANPTRRGSDNFRLAYGDFEGQRECEPARGSDSGGASRFLYVAKASSAERNAGLDGFEERGTTADGYGSIQTPKLDRAAPRENWTPHPVRNVHPTVKPIALMRWLVRLVTPPEGTVLDPFAGSGTTGIAAALESFDFIGIEREVEYAAIAQARIAWWARHPDGMTLVKRLEAEAEQAATAAAGQSSLFDIGGAV